MDDFKRKYSNEAVKVSVPYFWEKFDKEHYSIWRCEYKYPEELKLMFMSSNLIQGTLSFSIPVSFFSSVLLGDYIFGFVCIGMYQRLDKLRRNAFGCMVLSGTKNDSAISGLWVWRGHELVFTVS